MKKKEKREKEKIDNIRKREYYKVIQKYDIKLKKNIMKFNKI